MRGGRGLQRAIWLLTITVSFVLHPALIPATSELVDERFAPASPASGRRVGEVTTRPLDAHTNQSVCMAS